MMTPDYKKIYTDLLNKKYPEKIKECTGLLNKKELSVIDILELDRRIFGKREKAETTHNQKFRSYKMSDIQKILDYQRNHRLNNSQLANHFQLSRNTVAKWRKLFSDRD